MISKIKHIWSEYSFEVILVLSIVFIIGLFIYRKIKNKNGSWTENLILKGYNATGQIPYTENSKSDSKGEIVCRRVLEQIFKKPFKKARPNWLNNSVTKNNLELDCYNDELKLAVEYQGEQHYKYIPYFHKNKESFLNGQYRDDMKRRICKDNGIILIEVPYNVRLDNIELYIKAKLAEYNINLI